jgi:glycosyltransferase involved in cell wall biosynthesis
MANYSVLMSVYHKERPEFLRLSVESIFAQTVPTDDFVLMCDGPLTAALDSVIADLQNTYGSALHVVRCEVNRGLSYALNDGLTFCKNDLVARMDSDDIAPANRCELQLQAFQEDPQLVIVGGAIDEFEGSLCNVVSHKDMPLSHEDILRYAKKRNPFNHPTVMYRKSAVLTAGGYPHIPLHEDYALWAKLLASGTKGRNLPQTLCNMRVDSGLYNRRGGWTYFKTATKFRYHLYQSGFYSLWNFLYVTAALVVVCLIPQHIRRVAYLKLLRKK